MTFSLELLVLLVSALAVSAIGFKNYVWFISLGYGCGLAAIWLVAYK